MSIKAVIFDMDGVIFDSERAVYNCWLDQVYFEGFIWGERITYHPEYNVGFIV